ncbi:RCC1 domain-containing protein [Paenibacillus sp. GCM10012307]|nr:hypothetical protein [Paenibacillus roseus]
MFRNFSKPWRAAVAGVLLLAAFSLVAGSVSASNTPGKDKSPQYLTHFKSIAAGRYHALLVSINGNVWDWNVETEKAQLVPGIKDVVEVATYLNRNVALKKDGTVWEWGLSNDISWGSIKEEIRRPRQVKGLSDITAISSGYGFLALSKAGSVYAWDDSKSEAAQLEKLSNVKKISGDSQVLLKDGTVWREPDLEAIIDIAAGDMDELVLKKDGTVWMKFEEGRSNYFGQFGNGTNTDPDSPGWYRVPGLERVTSIYAGWDHFFAQDEDGVTWGWGKNREAQLGTGSTDQQNSPVKLVKVKNMVRLAAGDVFSLYMKKDGTVYKMSNYGRSFIPNYNEAASLSPQQIRIPIKQK